MISRFRPARLTIVARACTLSLNVAFPDQVVDKAIVSVQVFQPHLHLRRRRMSQARSFAIVRTIKEDSTWITDTTGTLSAEDREEITSIIRELFDKYGVELSILVEPSAGSDISPREKALNIFNTLGIGSKERNNGILIYMALEQRRIEMVVGDGLQQALPNEWVVQTMERLVVPVIHKSGKGAGLVEAANLCADALWRTAQHNIEQPWIFRGKQSRRPLENDGHNSDGNNGNSRKYSSLFSALVLAGLVALIGRRYRDSNNSKTCKNCKYHPIEEKDADIAIGTLTPCERMELEIGSVAWKRTHCPNCGEQDVVRYEVPMKHLRRFGDCPRCKCRTVVVDRPIVVVRPTSSTDGYEMIRSDCKLCGYQDESRTVLNRTEGASSSSSHGGGTSSGGGGGASF